MATIATGKVDVTATGAVNLAQTGTLTLRARLENLSGRPYVGSVIVGDANRRYYEAAPGRNWLAGITGLSDRAVEAQRVLGSSEFVANLKRDLVRIDNELTASYPEFVTDGLAAGKTKGALVSAKRSICSSFARCWASSASRSACSSSSW